MNGDIKITIATPVFNGAATLREALDSVVNQTYTYIQYVVTDGGSTDGSVNILNEYAGRYPDIITFVSEPDKGIYDAMNKAAKLSDGDFLLFLGCDDVLYNNKVLEDFAAMITDKYSVYYGDVVLKGTRETFAGSFAIEKLLMQNICHQCIFYPKAVYRQLTYNLKYKLFADWDYNLNAWSQYGAFKRLELVVALYKETGLSATQDAVFLKDRIQLARQYFGDKYTWLLKMQGLKKKLLGKTDLRKVKGYFLPKIK